MGIKKDHVLNCMFSNWYPKFQHLTIKSYILPLPEDFVKYLQEDGPLVLPRGADIGSQTVEEQIENGNRWTADDAAADELSEPEFPKLIMEMEKILQILNNKAFPKMNWSAPKDATWITASNTLKCSTPGEVLLLLKSSDFVTFDLTSAFKLCDDSSTVDPFFQKELILRKWANLVPGMEFRCFVRDRKLIAACQRNHRQYFDYVETQKDIITIEICRFLQEHILNEFANNDYVVDIYKKRNGEYWVIDFNPWGPATDPLLFAWSELHSMEPNLLTEKECPLINPDGEVVGEFRYTRKNATMQPSETLSYRMPQDFVDLSRGEDATKLVDFLRLKIQDGDDSDTNDDEPWQLPKGPYVH